MRARFTGSGGFTLLENMMALVLLSVSFLFVAAVFPASNDSVDRSTNRMAASFVAENALENARATDFASLANSSGNDATFVTVSGGNSQKAVTFAWTVTVTTPATGLKDLLVTVTWAETDGTAQSLKVQTRVAQVEP